jgi:hypothetical protein
MTILRIFMAASLAAPRGRILTQRKLLYLFRAAGRGKRDYATCLMTLPTLSKISPI